MSLYFFYCGLLRVRFITLDSFALKSNTFLISTGPLSLKFLTLHFVGRQKELNYGCPDKPSVKSGGEEEEEGPLKSESPPV